MTNLDFARIFADESENVKCCVKIVRNFDADKMFLKLGIQVWMLKLGIQVWMLKLGIQIWMLTQNLRNLDAERKFMTLGC